VDRTYVAETATRTTFAERLTATCAKLGVFHAEWIFFVSDRESALAWIREQSLPTAIELLDWYTWSNIPGGVGLAYPDVLARALWAAQPGEVDALLAILREHARVLESGTSSRPPGHSPSSATRPTTGAVSPTIGSSRSRAPGRRSRAST